MIKFEQLKAQVESIGGRLTKEKVLINGRGWSRTQYEFWHPKLGHFISSSLKEMESDVNQLRLDISKTTGIPTYGFLSQALQCYNRGKYASDRCWSGCSSIAALKAPDFTGPCPRNILDKYGRKFHVGE